MAPSQGQERYPKQIEAIGETGNCEALAASSGMLYEKVLPFSLSEVFIWLEQVLYDFEHGFTLKKGFHPLSAVMQQGKRPSRRGNLMRSWALLQWKRR